MRLVCNPGRFLEIEGTVTLVPLADGGLEARVDGEKLADKLQAFIEDLSDPYYVGRVRISIVPAHIDFGLVRALDIGPPGL